MRTLQTNRASNPCPTGKGRRPFVQKKMPPWESVTSPCELSPLYWTSEEAEQARILVMDVLDKKTKRA